MEYTGIGSIEFELPSGEIGVWSGDFWFVGVRDDARMCGILEDHIGKQMGLSIIVRPETLTYSLMEA